VLHIRQKTPIGAAEIINVIILPNTTFALSMTLANESAALPTTRIATPIKRAITITYNIDEFENATHILLGKKFTIVSAILVVPAVYSVLEVSMGGKKSCAPKGTAKPINTAINVVIMKNTIVFQPIDPSFFISPMEIMPQISDNKTRGTAMNFKRLMKIVPNGLM